MTVRLEQETGLALLETVLPELGFDRTTNTWSPGVFAEGTERQNKDVIIRQIQQRGGLSKSSAEQVSPSRFST